MFTQVDLSAKEIMSGVCCAPPTTALAKVGGGGCRVGFVKGSRAWGSSCRPTLLGTLRNLREMGCLVGNAASCQMLGAGSFSQTSSHCHVPLCATQFRECIHSPEDLLPSETVLMDLEAVHPKLRSCLDGSSPSLFKGCFLCDFTLQLPDIAQT